MALKNWYDRVREQLGRLDFPALWAGFAPCPFALYTHCLLYTSDAADD